MYLATDPSWIQKDVVLSIPSMLILVGMGESLSPVDTCIGRHRKAVHCGEGYLHMHGNVTVSSVLRYVLIESIQTILLYLCLSTEMGKHNYLRIYLNTH